MPTRAPNAGRRERATTGELKRRKSVQIASWRTKSYKWRSERTLDPTFSAFAKVIQDCKSLRFASKERPAPLCRPSAAAASREAAK
jgi:hypothetical protein